MMYFSNDDILKLNVFHDVENLDAIIERRIVESPDFDKQDEMVKLIMREIERFATENCDHILH